MTTGTDTVVKAVKADVWHATLPLIAYLTGIDETEILQRPYALFRELYTDRLDDAAFGDALEQLRHMVEYTASDSMPDAVYGSQRRAFYTRYTEKIFGPLGDIVLAAPPGQINELSHQFRNAYATVSDHFVVPAGSTAIHGKIGLISTYPRAYQMAWGVGGQQGQVVRCMVMSLYILQRDPTPSRPMALTAEERTTYRQVSELFVAMLAWAAEGYTIFPHTVIEA